MARLSTQQIRDARLADWRKLAQCLHARYRTKDFASAVQFVTEVARAADAANHHPDVKLSYGVVDLALCTHEDGRWVTEQDLDLARTISGLAQQHGLTAEPTEVAQLELALDTPRFEAIAPFWSVLLTGSPDNRVADSIFDPTDRVPPVWFQGTDPHETPRQRWHFDLWLAPEVADERIGAAVAHGGTVVNDSEAPSFTVLADPDGNKVCVCTYLDRA